MKISFAGRCAVGVALGLGAGCASFSTMKTARAIDPGTSEVTLAASGIGNTISSPGNGKQTQIDPQFEIGVRYGIVPGLDLGGKCWWVGCELNSTISFVRSRAFDLALAPSVGLIDYQYDDIYGNTIGVAEFYAKIPLLFGLRFGHLQEDEFVFGPEIVPISVLTGDEYGNGTAQTGALVGGTVGVSLRVAPFLRVMPELTVLTPIAPFDAPGGQVIQHYGDNGAVFYQAGFGIAWGNDGLGHPRYVPPPPHSYAPPPEGSYPPPQNYPPPQSSPPPYRTDE